MIQITGDNEIPSDQVLSDIYIMAKEANKKKALRDNILESGYNVKEIDVTNIPIGNEKKQLLFVCNKIFPKLDQQTYESKLKKNFHVYTVYDADKDIRDNEVLEGYVVLPFEKSELKTIVYISCLKNQFHSEKSRLINDKQSLEKISSLGQYTGSLIHDLNNYNTICMTSLDGLKILNDSRYQDTSMSFLVDKGLKGSKMISALAGKYRKFLRVDSLNDAEFINLGKMIEETLGFLQREIVKKQIEVNVKIPIDYFVYCIEISFIQVLMNLLVNSIYAIKDNESRWIKIHLKQLNNSLALCITDSGEGIAKEIRDKIFDPLFTTKPNEEGTGFGLSFCDKELKEMGMELSYIVSKNTVFSITIPKTHFKKTMVHN